MHCSVAAGLLCPFVRCIVWDQLLVGNRICPKREPVRSESQALQPASHSPLILTTCKWSLHCHEFARHRQIHNKRTYHRKNWMSGWEWDVKSQSNWPLVNRFGSQDVGVVDLYFSGQMVVRVVRLEFGFRFAIDTINRDHRYMDSAREPTWRHWYRFGVGVTIWYGFTIYVPVVSADGSELTFTPMPCSETSSEDHFESHEKKKSSAVRIDHTSRVIRSAPPWLFVVVELSVFGLALLCIWLGSITHP